MKKGIFSLCFALLSIILFAQTNYNYKRLNRESLNRGVVAVRSHADTVMIGWRYLSSDPLDVGFNLYRNGECVTITPITESTQFFDAVSAECDAVYEVRPVVKGKEKVEKNSRYHLPSHSPIGYLPIPITAPAPQVMPNGSVCSYSANDASIGDLTGDGEYEIILKWEPTNARDNAHDGFTGTVFVDAYRLNGERLWRIDLGRNIRAGAHYTQFMVYDFDGDGRAEIVMKTADGTVDGVGMVIGDSTADYRSGVKEAIAYAKTRSESSPSVSSRQEPRNDGFPTSREVRDSILRPRRPRTNNSDNNTFSPELREQQQRQGRMNRSPGGGRILSGPEFLTIFEGNTGRALSTIDYIPARGDVKSWGDSYGNRSERYLACIAYLDGKRPSVVMCRGYYTRSVLAAFDWDGKELKTRWVFDSDNPGNEAYYGQGNHNLRVGDVDGDGCDEIIYGSCCINNNGLGLYSTGMGHGDAMHLTAFYPNNEALQVWCCHENRRDGSTLRDARTGDVIWQRESRSDVGRCMVADIDPTNPGLEMWSSNTEGICDVKGNLIARYPRGLSTNMAVWWDGDLLRELLDRNSVSKYDWTTQQVNTLTVFDDCSFNNGSKNNPCLQGDIIGDWREEVLVRTRDNSELRLYVSTIPTDYRFHTFLEDPVYRISIATQNVSYNQPTQTGFYFGSDLEKGSIFRGTRIQ